MAAAFVVVGQRGTVAFDASFRISIEHGHEPAGIGKWQRTKQDRVDHGEDRQIGAKTDGERQKSSNRESGRLSQQSGGIAQFPHKLIKQVKATSLAAVPFDIGKVAELYAGTAGRFLR